MTRFFKLFFFSLLFASCSGQIEKPITPFIDPAISETPVIHSSSTPTATERILAAASPDFATPTLFKDTLEISFDITPTPIPISRLAPIAPDNASDIELLTVLGGGEVYSLAWSPDSQFLAAGTSTGLKLYSVQSPDAPPLQISPLTPIIMKVAFSPVSAFVAGEVRQDSGRRTIQVWDVEKGELLRDDDLPFDQVFDLEFNPEGNLLAISGGSKGILLVDLVTGSARDLLAVQGEARVLAFSHSGTLLAAWGYRDGMPVIHLLDLENGAQTGLLELHDPSHGVKSFEFSPDGRTLAVGGSRSVELWQVESQSLVQDLKPGRSTSTINTVIFSQDGTQLLGASTNEKKLWVWNIASGDVALEKNLSSGDIALSPDGKMLRAGFELLEVKSWNLIDNIPVFQEQVTQVVFMPDGQALVAAYEGGSIRVWDIAENLVTSELAGSEAIRSQVISPDGQLVARSEEMGLLKIREIQTGAVISAVEVASQAFALKFSPDSGSVVFADAMGIQIFRFRTSQRPILLWEEPGYLGDLAFSHSGSALAASALDAETHLEEIRVWNAVNGMLLTTIGPGLPARSSKLAFDSDETLLFVGDPWDGTIGLYSLGSGNRLETLGIPPGDYDISVDDLLFNPDGSALASITSGTVTLWRMSDRSPISLAGNYKYFVSLAFNPSGSILASGGNVNNNIPNSADGDLRLWDAGTGALLVDLVDGSYDVFLDVQFSPDGRLLAAASEIDVDTIWIWGVLTQVD